MAIFTLLGTAIAAGLGLAGATLFGASVASIIAGGLSLAASVAWSYINRPKTPKYTAVQGEVQVGSETPSSMVYGKAKVKGHRVYYARWGKGNAWNGDIFILSDGWCGGLEPEIYFYGKKHTLLPQTPLHNEVARYHVEGFGDDLIIRFYDGRPGQDHDVEMVAATAGTATPWLATSNGANLTYVAISRRWSERKFDKGTPEFEFVLRGRRLYDPRKDSSAGGFGTHRANNSATWEWSDNPALIRRDYLIGHKGLISGQTMIGVGKTAAMLDTAMHVTAANVADAIADHGKRTYQCNQFVTADDDHIGILQTIEDAMAGYAVDRAGLDGVLAGAAQTPVLTLTDEDIRIDEPRTRQERRHALDTINVLSGQFTSPDDNWSSVSLTPVTSNTDIANDGAERRAGNDFLQVIDADVAQYLLTIRYRQNRFGAKATLPVSRRSGVCLQPGDWVTWRSRTWMVQGWRIDESFRFTLELAETSADIYDESEILPGPVVGTAPETVNTDEISVLSGFGVTAGVVAGEGSEQRPALAFAWTNPDDPTVTGVLIEYRVIGTTAPVFTRLASDPVAGGDIVTENVTGGQAFEARALIITDPDRLRDYTGWVAAAALTPPVMVGTDNLASEVTDRFAEIEAEARASATHLADEARTLSERIRRLAGDITGLSATAQVTINRLSLAVDGKASVEVTDGILADITEIGNNLTAIGAQIVAINTTIPGLATSDALATLSGQVSVIGDLVTALSSSVTDLQTAIPGLASAGALSALSTVVTELNGVVTALSESLTSVAATANNATASGRYGVTVSAGSGSTLARFASTMNLTVGGTTYESGFFNELWDDGGTVKSRFAVNANQFVVVDGPSSVSPFSIVGGKVQIQDLEVVTANIGTLTFGTSNLAFNTILDDDELVGTKSIANNTNWQTVASITIDNPNPSPIFMDWSISQTASGTGLTALASATMETRLIRTNDSLVIGSVSVTRTTNGSFNASDGGLKLFRNMIQGANTFEVQQRKTGPGYTGVSGSSTGNVQMMWLKR